MNAHLSITLSYDREKDGSLSEFRTKYNNFKAHLERLQTSGQLPREPIKWKLEIHRPYQPPPSSPRSPARILNGPWLAPYAPPIVHQQGTPLQVMVG